MLVFPKMPLNFAKNVSQVLRLLRLKIVLNFTAHIKICFKNFLDKRSLSKLVIRFVKCRPKLTIFLGIRVSSVQPVKCVVQQCITPKKMYRPRFSVLRSWGINNVIHCIIFCFSPHISVFFLTCFEVGFYF